MPQSVEITPHNSHLIFLFFLPPTALPPLRQPATEGSMRGTNSAWNAHAGCEHTAAHPTRGLEIPPRGTPGWTTHHFGAGHADRCPRGLQFPHHPRRGGTPPRNTPAHRGPSGLARRARTYPWREPRGHFSPPRPRRVWVTIGRLPACFPGKGTQWLRCHTKLIIARVLLSNLLFGKATRYN